jgi:hypothetical protein
MSGRLHGTAAAIAWALLCVRWFDVAAPWRPRWLAAIPVTVMVLLFAATVVVLRKQGGAAALAFAPAAGSRREMWLLAALAVAFRLPMAWTAAVGYTTSDGSLSGVVALRIREGLEHFVFVPSVPYSGSLKSHLAAALGLAVDLQRAFTLSSILFYGLFVAALYAIASLLDERGDGAPVVARGAALYAAFAPAFVTRYSLSNDGNYVEVLALGTCALLLAARGVRAESEEARSALAWGAGIALGLAFWCHILAIIHAAAVFLVFAAFAPRALARATPRLLLGGALGYLPGLLWNAANEWDSLHYILPGGQSVGALSAGPSWPQRLAGILGTQAPVVAGYDPGYPGAAGVAMVAFAALALVAIAIAFVQALARFRTRRDPARGTLLLFTAVNVTISIVSLPYIPANPRYLLFLAAPIAVFVADAFARGPRRLVLGLLIAGGAAGSLAQWPDEAISDARWRGLVRDLRNAGITRCSTDFFLSAKINFISEEKIVCSSELGPTTTEYFLEYRTLVAAAATPPALIAVNPTAGDKLERKLQRLGVGYRRLNLMKPVLIPERSVSKAELFGAAARDRQQLFDNEDAAAPPNP